MDGNVTFMDDKIISLDLGLTCTSKLLGWNIHPKPVVLCNVTFWDGNVTPLDGKLRFLYWGLLALPVRKEKLPK